MISLPSREYQIIYADPPWNYKDKATAGRRGAEYKYPCMSLEDLYDLPVVEIAHGDSALFLWATAPMLPDAIMVMQEWGFVYKTIAFSWVKRTAKNKLLHWGMGSWTRANTEVCLLGIRGKPKRMSASVHQVIESPIGRHSQKPAEVRARIVKLLGDLPRIELFARERVDGWDVWGNEVQQ